MFRKGVEVKPSANLKSSEKRKLQQILNTQMPGFKVPDKFSKSVMNNHLIQKGALYFNAENKDPILLQFRDNPNFVPTLQGLWSSIDPANDHFVCIPVIVTHDAVIDRLINGANLMIRGCMGPYGPGLKPNAYVAVVNYKRPNIPVAVGICMMDLEGKDDDEAPDSGVAVEIITVVGDDLCRLGRNVTDILKELSITVVDDESDKASIENGVINGDDVSEIGKGVATVDLAENKEVNKRVASDEEDYESVNKDAQFNAGDTNADGNADEPYVMSTEDIDEMFKRSVLYTLSQDTLEYPILASQFISAHVLKNLPPVDTNIVNVKKTSWKKTAKFLKAMEKDNLIKLKGKDDSLNVISAAPRDDPRVAAFVPYRIKKPNADREIAINTSGEAVVPPLLITKYLKPNNSARMLFNKIDEKYDAYYTEKEMKNFVQKYIKQNPSCVSKANAQMIEPNGILQEFHIKKNIKRAELADKVIASCSPYYTMYREGDAESDDVLVKKRLVPKKGNIPTITIVMENTKVGRKVITLISGCENFYIDVDKLANTLKVKCSGSSTITDGKTPKDGKVIMVQGKHDAIVLDVLHKQWGVPPKVCVVDNKTKGKGRRK